MKQRITIFAILILLVLPGCVGGLVDLTKKTFPQGQQYADHKSVVRRYIREVNVYDQFTTLALFDAMWLSDEIRTLYTNVYAEMFGKDQDAKEAILRRQLKANAHFISFYVLSTHKVSLSVKPVSWALYLEIDGKKYLPFEVKAVELPAQYQTFFGKHFNRHKQAYEVKFDRNDANANNILEDNKPHTIKLFFSSATRYAAAQWHVSASGKVEEKKKTSSAPLPESKKKKKMRKGRS